MRKTVLATLLLVLSSIGLASAEKISLGSSNSGLDVVVEESSDSRIVIRYELGAFETNPVDINGETFHAPTLGKEGTFMHAGEPALPHVARSVIIPNEDHMAVRVISSDYEDFENMPVAPSKGNLLRTVNPEDVPYTFGDVYAKDAFYPEALASLRAPFILRDFRGTVIEFNPFQYNPVTKTLRVYKEVTLEVYSDGPAITNIMKPRPQADRIQADFDLVYERRFLNYDQAAKYTSLGEIGDMLIITYDGFHDAMLPLVDWKLQKGIKTTMVDVSTIGNNTSSIQSFIQNFYDTTNLTFVLLVGDYLEVVTPQASGGASDPTYAKVAGSDDYPDIIVGRFSAESVADVETQVTRSIDYEKTPTGSDWFHQGTGIGSDDSGTGQGGEHDWEHEDLIRADLLAYTYTLVDQLYAPSATASGVTAALNAGRSIINYTGHGSTTAWSTTGFNNTNVNNLTNAGMLPFIISVACVNGEFDGYTCFGEAWLRATDGGNPTGAIGAYMSSINQSWSPPMDAQDEVTDLLVAEAKTSYGGLCYNGSLKMIEINGSDGISMYNTWHIFGDPSIQVRTNTPATLSVAHDAAVLFTATEVEVEVTGQENALCALYHDGVLYGSAYTDAGGIAVIPVTEQLPVGEDVTLTVTAYNAEPYIATVTAIAPSGPYVVLDYAVADDATGNGNGLVEPGEDIVAGVQLVNVGPDDAYDVTANISTTDSYVSITDGTESYGTIAGDNGAVYVADAFAFSVDSDIPDGHQITFDLEITGTARDTWTGTIRFTAHAPALSFVSVTINDASGNGNGVLDPGESAELVVALRNSGSGQAFNVDGFMSATDMYVTVDDSYGAFGTIDSINGQATSTDVFEVSADAGCPIGYAVQMQLQVSAGGGYMTDVYFDLTVGDRVVFFFDDFSYDKGWTGLGGAGEWTIGPVGGAGDDPSEDHTPTSDNQVLGNDLTTTSGEYNSNITTMAYVESPVIDCSGMSGVLLNFFRVLGVERVTYDHAVFEVYDGTDWVVLYENDDVTFQETEWTERNYDLSAYADHNASFQMRFGISSDVSVVGSGWNIDDMELRGYGNVSMPHCVMDQSAIMAELHGDAQMVHTLQVNNTGEGALNITFTPSKSWIHCDNSQNVIASGDSLMFDVTIDATGLETDTYVGAVEFVSNDMQMPYGDIVVQMTVTQGCCVGLTGNVDCDAEDNVDISDLTRLVNHLFVTLDALCCPEEANVNGDPEGSIDIADLTRLVNHLFVTQITTAPCQ